MKTTITLDYGIGDIVYLKTDSEQLPRMVVSIRLTPNGVIYSLQNGVVMTDHYTVEFSTDRNTLMTL